MQSLKYFRVKTINPEIRNSDEQPAMGKPVLTVLLLLMTVAGCSRQTEPPVSRTMEDAQHMPGGDPAEERPKPVLLTPPVEQTNSTTTATISKKISPENSANKSQRISDQPVPGSSDGLSARQAQQQATHGLKQARQRANQGDYTQAFKQASSAWFILQNHQDNPDNLRLAKELQQVMEEYGEKLNRKATQNASTTESRKPLTVE